MIDEKVLLESLERERFILFTTLANTGVAENDLEYEKRVKFIDRIVELVKNQPKVDKWISVKDRLPEEHDSMFAKCKNTKEWNSAMFEKISDDVNVTIEFEDGKRKTMTMHTIDGKWRDDFSLTKKKVIAWIPLPPKYEK